MMLLPSGMLFTTLACGFAQSGAPSMTIGCL
jgi:hypothetical protein